MIWVYSKLIKQIIKSGMIYEISGLCNSNLGSSWLPNAFGKNWIKIDSGNYSYANKFSSRLPNFPDLIITICTHRFNRFPIFLICITKFSMLVFFISSFTLKIILFFPWSWYLFFSERILPSSFLPTILFLLSL